MRLVEDWKKAWKWFSTWLLGMNATFVVLYSEVQAIQEKIPPKIAHYAILTLLFLTVLGRVIKQGESDGNTTQPPQ